MNVLATHIDSLDDSSFEPVAQRLLEWADRFQNAPGRDRVSVWTLAKLLVNKGLVLLRLGKQTEAQRTLDLAHATTPHNSAIEEASHLVSYDQHARQIALKIRSLPTAA